jgi:hypothetical protein
VETAGRASSVVIRFPAWDRELAFDIGAFEIRTFRLPRDAGSPAIETDLLERPIAPG